MEDVLQSKGLYQDYLGKIKLAPTDASKKAKWDNKNDEAHGLIKMSISSDLQFHLQGIDEPDEAWKKLETVFGKHNEIQAHQLENQLISLNPSDFSCIEDYLSKFKTLRLLLEDCKIEKKDDQCIYVILAKLGSAYFVFVSTFHSTREALGVAYKPPSLEYFCDSLIREKDKLLHLGVISIVGTSNKALVAQ
jgi:hypothetical protein